MEKRLLDPSYRFRPPKPNRFWEWALTPVRRRVYREIYGVRELEIRGEEHLQAALGAGHSVVLAINHPAHGDPFVVFEAMARLRVRCCYLAAWQVFTGWMGLKGFAFQRLGAFSIDREGTDVRAFRTAVDVLAQGKRSLVIFPEGEVYHLNDRVTPLREGAAMIALTAARRRRRSHGPPLYVVPCALKYFYLVDPTPQLESVMGRLEARIYWRPQPDRPLVDRIHRYAEAILALKELEYLQALGEGSLPRRISSLSEHILQQMEARHFAKVSGEPIPVRVKRLRYQILTESGAHLIDDDAAGESTSDATTPVASDEQRAAGRRDLEDLHLVTQLFSYPGDYVAENPTVERICETIDKFEEDALGTDCAGARTDRRAILRFGSPIDVTKQFAASKGKTRETAAALTTMIEQRMQEQLDRIQRV